MISENCTPVVKALYEALQANEPEKTAEIKAYKELVHNVYKHNADSPEVLRKAEFLSCFAAEFPVRLHLSERIVGSMKFYKNPLGCPDFNGNIGHMNVDYSFVLEQGVSGIIDRINRIETTDQNIFINREAYLKAANAFSCFIHRYAKETIGMSVKCTDPNEKNEWIQITKDCEHISEKAPASFRQALQLLWFIQVFLHAEGMCAAVSFGRFDRFMYSYYRRDMDRGILSEAQAKELLQCFWLKCCEGDDSQNLILGGDAENELSLLCLDVTSELCVWQPSISVSIGKNTSELFWEKTLRLIRKGTGMPAIFNDAMVIRALINAGIPNEDARGYSIVGCYEANPQGKALGLTVAGSWRLYEYLMDFLNGQDSLYGSFDNLYTAFKAYLKERYISRNLEEYKKMWEHIRKDTVSPFESLCFEDCLKTGLAAEEGGARYTMFGINILGLGTTVDSLFAIKKIVFDDKTVSFAALMEEVKNDFPNMVVLNRCRNLKGKYGSDFDYTNELAHDLSKTVANLVLGNRFDPNVIPYPGLFLFLADIRSKDIPATPDGRRRGDRVSFGIAASEYCSEKTPTSMLNSAVHVCNDLCACGNPMQLSFGKTNLDGAKGDMIIQSLIKGYFDKGGFHLQFNLVEASTLEDAVVHPELYSDLLVRISGFSAKFIELDRELQRTIIARIKLGM